MVMDFARNQKVVMHQKMVYKKIVSLFVLVMSGCIFNNSPLVSEEYLTETESYKNKVVERNHIPEQDRATAEKLVLPIYDENATGSDTVNHVDVQAVVEENGKRQAYILSVRRVPVWREKEEFDWSQFFLRTHYYFQENLTPKTDTTMNPKDIYENISNESYTTYYDTAEAADIDRQLLTTATPGAIGIRTGLVPSADTILIRHVYDNSPAQKVGLLPGMRFLTINDSSVVGDSASSLFFKFAAGDSGTVLQLDMLVEGVQKSFRLVKDVVSFPSVLLDTISDIPHITITSFSSQSLPGLSTYLEFRNALSQTASSKVTLLDLRGNGGGSVFQTLEMLNELIESGIVIRHWQRALDDSGIPRLSEKNIYAGYAGMALKRSFILLANSRSASASEIFISALTEAKSFPLVGVKTYGKGVGQTFLKTPGGGRVKITNSLFKTRRQEVYNLIGIQPTHDTGDQEPLEVAVELAKKQLGKSSATKTRLSENQHIQIETANLNRKLMLPQKICPIIIEDR